jgi:hypothetical protein
VSWMGRLMAAWPWIHGGLLALTLWGAWWGVPLVLYVLPPMLHRLHARVYPLQEGAHPLVGHAYVPWWGSHQLQVIFTAVPSLEAILRVLGLYSPWLRLWGARVGRGVYWTPLVEITDRSLLEIGDGVVVGHRCGFYAHAIKPARGNLYLFAKRIRIGERAFLGAGCGFGPGARVEAGAYLPLRTEVMPGKAFRARDGQGDGGS